MMRNGPRVWGLDCTYTIPSVEGCAHTVTFAWKRARTQTRRDTVKPYFANLIVEHQCLMDLVI